MAKKTETAAKAPKAPAAKINVKPGSTVTVKVVKQPTSERAAKTLVRLLGKDRETHKEKEKLQQMNRRSQRQKPRGGRLYELNVRKRAVLDGSVGETGTIKATVDVIRDLNSVARFVEVSPK